MRELIQGRNHIDGSPKFQQTLKTLEMSLAKGLDLPRILVADNDPYTGQLLTSIGQTPAHKVVAVSDGREAYRVLKSDADFLAAIFNMTMPHLQGVDIIRYMKTEKRLMRIPVVVVCGENGIKLMGDSFAAGAIAFLSKPFNADQLQRVLRVAISSRSSRKELRRAA
jgi:DNA-binding NtrC family response regulator